MTATPTTIHPSSTAPSPSTTSATPKPLPPQSSTAPNSTSHPTTKKTSPPTSSAKPGDYPSPTAATAAPHASASSPPNDYGNASSTGTAPTNKTTDTTAAPASPSSHSPLETLNPRLTGILLHIELPITWYGYSEREAATRLGVTTATVRRCRTELHNHLLAEEQQR